jgi:NADPH:quinone reductase
MAHAIRLGETGAPQAMQWEETEVGKPAAGELRVRHTALGLNYIDVYHRKGLYPLPLPTGLGVEGAGVVEEVGQSVNDIEVGDRIVYAGGPPGAYATERLLPASRAIKLPDYIDDQLAASVFMKGLTVEYLIRRCHHVERGDYVLWHAAAGGVGSLACQWLSHIGATVIGTVGTAEKMEHARKNGCDYPVNYKSEDFVARVREITNGTGVSAVYDSVGKDTFTGSIDSLRTRGILISFGTASGPTPPLDLALLGAKGSLFVTRASSAQYTARREELEAAAATVFDMLKNGFLRADTPKVFPLKEIVAAHQELEGARTSGSVVLIP